MFCCQSFVDTDWPLVGQTQSWHKWEVHQPQKRCVFCHQMCLLCFYQIHRGGNTHVSRVLSGRSPKSISRALIRTGVRHFTFIPVPQEGHATTRIEELKKWVLPKFATVDQYVRNTSTRKSVHRWEVTSLLSSPVVFCHTDLGNVSLICFSDSNGWGCPGAALQSCISQRVFTLSVHQLCSAEENKDHLLTVGLDKSTLKSATMRETWPQLSALSCLSVPSTVLGHAPAMMLLSRYLLEMPSVPVWINFFYFPTLLNLNEGDIAGGNSSKYTLLYFMCWFQPRSAGVVYRGSVKTSPDYLEIGCV